MHREAWLSCFEEIPNSQVGMSLPNIDTFLVDEIVDNPSTMEYFNVIVPDSQLTSLQSKKV